MHRVQKILSNRGYCSRRRAETLISEGRVHVNGTLVSLGDKAREDDDITVDDQPIVQEVKRYLKFNKPAGYVTALSDRHEKTIMDLIDIPERVYPIGRLDKDTQGLLLLTNDGDFANAIMHPRYEIEKTYLVELTRSLEDDDAQRIEAGIILDDGKSAPARIAHFTPTKIQITIHEGRNRIVRRIFETLNYPIRTLTRIRIGTIGLGDLKSGEYQDLTAEEKRTVCGNRDSNPGRH